MEYPVCVKGLKAIAIWIAGLAIGKLLLIVLPIVLDVISSDSTIQSIGALFGYIVIIGGMVLYPLFHIILVAQEPNTMKPMQEIVLNGIILLTGLIALFLANYIFVAGAGLFETTFELTIYWVSTIVAFGGALIGLPLFRILKARNVI